MRRQGQSQRCPTAYGEADATAPPRCRATRWSPAISATPSSASRTQAIEARCRRAAPRTRARQPRHHRGRVRRPLSTEPQSGAGPGCLAAALNQRAESRHTVPREPRRRVRQPGGAVASRPRGGAGTAVRRPRRRGRAAAGDRQDGVRRTVRRAARPRRPAAGGARLVPAQRRAGLRGVRRPVRRHAGGRRGARRPPHRTRRHLPAPDAAADPSAGTQRRRVRRRRLPHRAARPGRRRGPARAGHHPARARGSASASTSCSTTRPASTPGPWRPGRATTRSATTTSSSPTAICPTSTSSRCPRCSPTSRPAASPGTRTSTGWVWTTFNDYQWDLNWANPSVLCEFADILLGWANVGVEVFRLDAIAFLWKRMGTSCQNQPEVHDLTQALRTVARIAAPAVLFKAEAIVGPGRAAGVPRHRRPRRQGLRPRVPQQPDGAGLVDARVRRGRARERSRCRTFRSHRRPRPGSPTCAATTTSAGPSTTPTRGGRGSTASRTAGSCPTGTPAPTPARGPAAWSSRRTTPPATAGSAAPWRRWPGASATTPGPSRASCSRTP